MIKQSGEYTSEVRHQMRGGNGDVKIEHLFDCAKELQSHPRLLAKLTLEKGATIGYHEHQGEEEVFYILRGTAELDDNGTKVILKAGDSILTSNAGHSLSNAGDDTLEVMAVILKFS